MTDADGNVVIVDDDSRSSPAPTWIATAIPSSPTPTATLWKTRRSHVEFDADGNYIFQPEVIDTLAVDQQYIQVVARGDAMVNQHLSDDEFGTGATYVDWNGLEAAGPPRARRARPNTATTSPSPAAGAALRTSPSGAFCPPTPGTWPTRPTMTRRSPCPYSSSTAARGRLGHAGRLPRHRRLLRRGQYASLMGDLTPDEAAAQTPVPAIRLFCPIYRNSTRQQPRPRRSIPARRGRCSRVQGGIDPLTRNRASTTTRSPRRPTPSKPTPGRRRLRPDPAS
jgi:hypothetical protein